MHDENETALPRKGDVVDQRMRNAINLELSLAREEMGVIDAHYLSMSNRQFRKACRELGFWLERSAPQIAVTGVAAYVLEFVDGYGVPPKLIIDTAREQMALVYPEAGNHDDAAFVEVCRLLVQEFGNQARKLQAASIAYCFLKQRDHLLGKCGCKKKEEAVAEFFGVSREELLEELRAFPTEQVFGMSPEETLSRLGQVPPEALAQAMVESMLSPLDEPGSLGDDISPFSKFGPEGPRIVRPDSRHTIVRPGRN